jgi:hypothetical protein
LSVRNFRYLQATLVTFLPLLSAVWQY